VRERERQADRQRKRGEEKNVVELVGYVERVFHPEDCFHACCVTTIIARVTVDDVFSVV
jgi:hypothetical protein